MIGSDPTAAALTRMFGAGSTRPIDTPLAPPQSASLMEPRWPLSGFENSAMGPRWPLSGFDQSSAIGQRFPLSGFNPGTGPDLFRAEMEQSQANYQNQMAERIAQFGGAPGAPPPAGIPGSMSSPGGSWSNVDRWDAFTSEASGKYGIPANLLKAVMMLESGGDPSSGSPQGATGLMQIMPFWDGTAGYSIHDPRQNVLLGAYILKDSYDRWAAQGASDPWQEAVKDYIGRGGPDAFGTTAETYWPRIQQYWNELNSGANQTPVGSGGGGSVGGGWQNSFATMFGTNSVPDWGEFNAPSSNGLYGYGTDYGLNGSNHTGIDIPLALNTPMRAGFSGTVVCSATGSGTGQDSCSAFNDYYGGGAGRIQLMSDDGNVMLIYGHSSQTAVRPGQRVNAGDLVGYSGGQNSPHVHLEARVRDSSTSSGWRLVDPRTVLGGGVPVTGGGGGYGGAPPGGYSSGPMSFDEFWRTQYNR